jgi:hypothetical protein
MCIREKLKLDLTLVRRLLSKQMYIRVVRTMCMLLTKGQNLDIKTANYNSVVLFRERTLPTERPALVGEVRASFSG